MRLNNKSSSSTHPTLSLYTQPDRQSPDSQSSTASSPLSSTTTSPTTTHTPNRNSNSSGPPFFASSATAARRDRLPSVSVLSRRPSLILLRRRPSKIDMQLSAERTRCDEDAVERQGLDLMEPRPVDPVGIPMDLNANVFSSAAAASTFLPGDRSSALSSRTGSSSGSHSSGMAAQPRFVMGGIFEVMEGRA